MTKKKRYCCGYQMLQIHYHATGEHKIGQDGKQYTERVGIICRECYKTILDPICNLVIERKRK